MWRIVMALLGLWMLSCPPAQAEQVTESLPHGLKALADHRAGRADAPAVLILHGFLVNHQFPTVQSLAGDLAAKGYTVLAPTLSLGITRRRSGLACDAIHTHTLDDDVAEIAFWIDWLAKRKHKDIILIGHSFGSVQLLAYLTRQQAPQVRGLVAMSMSHVGAKGEELRPQERVEAERQQAAGDAGLARRSLIYCRGNYTSTPAAYLSYARLGHDRVLELLQQNRKPLQAIMGGADERFGSDWVGAMRDAGAQVRVVEGASHFFDGTHEFDLLDEVNAALPAMLKSR